MYCKPVKLPRQAEKSLFSDTLPKAFLFGAVCSSDEQHGKSSVREILQATFSSGKRAGDRGRWKQLSEKNKRTGFCKCVLDLDKLLWERVGRSFTRQAKRNSPS